MAKKTENRDDAIIDLEVDQVVEQVNANSQQDAVQPNVPKGKGSPLLYGAAALLAASVAGGWIYKDLLSGYWPSNQVRGLSEKISDLESRNTALREQLAGLDKLTSQLTSDVDRLEAKEQELSDFAETAQKNAGETTDKLARLEAGLGETKHALDTMTVQPGTGAAIDGALQQRVASLEKDVASLKVKPTGAVENTAALSQNLADLKAKIAGGVGYREEFDRVERMVPAAAGLDVLAQYASLGIPAASGLAAELKALVKDLPKPIIPGPVAENDGWWAGLYRSMSGLITIKIEGEVDWPTTAMAALAFAESGDLTQAIEVMDKVEAAKPVGVQQWIERASARLKIENALQSVEEAVLRVIAAKG